MCCDGAERWAGASNIRQRKSAALDETTVIILYLLLFLSSLV